MNRDVAQLISLWIDNEETLYNFALTSKATAEGVRRVTPAKQLEFELRRKNEFREGLIDGFRSLFVIGAKGAEYYFRGQPNNQSLQLGGPNASFSQTVSRAFETESGKELLGKFIDKYTNGEMQTQFSPEVQCILIMLAPFWVRWSQTI